LAEDRRSDRLYPLTTRRKSSRCDDSSFKRRLHVRKRILRADQGSGMRTSLYFLVVCTLWGLGCTGVSSPAAEFALTATEPAGPSLRSIPEGCVWSEEMGTGRQLTICRGVVENISGHDLEQIYLRIRFPTRWSDPDEIAFLAAGASMSYEITLPGAQSPKTGYLVIAEDALGEPIRVHSD
jgi:hypothetical protein